MSFLSLKKAPESVIPKHESLHTLIDLLPDYIYFKDTQSRFTDANKATLRIMKCRSLEDCVGKTDFDFYPKEFAEKYFADENEIFRTGEPKLDIEETTPDEHGHLGYYSTSKVPLKDNAGKVVGLVGIGRNITERKKIQEVAMQVEINKTKRLSDIGTLTAIVAHELRNPLGVIQLSLQHLKKDKTMVDNRDVLNIEKKLWEGNRIIDNLLNYSRLKPPFYESCNLLSLVDESVSCVPGKLEDHQIVVEKKYNVRGSTTIEIDPYQIKEVFINIFNNACEALPNKTGKIEVTVQSEEGHHVCVAFKDNGIGIDEKDLNKIFTPFFTQKSRGTGLGLAICQELVNLHNGRIEVQSWKDRGTIFRVILPLRRLSSH